MRHPHSRQRTRSAAAAAGLNVHFMAAAGIGSLEGRPPCRPPPTSTPRQRKHLALERPFIGRSGQSLPHGIYPHIDPFLVVMRPRPHLRVPIVPLPQFVSFSALWRDGLRPVRIRDRNGRHGGRPSKDRWEMPGNLAFPKLDPLPHARHRNPSRSAKQMDVVRHDDIAPYAPEIRCFPNLAANPVHRLAGQNRLPILSADRCQQDYRLVEVLDGWAVRGVSAIRMRTIIHGSSPWRDGLCPARIRDRNGRHGGRPSTKPFRHHLQPIR